MTLFWMIYAVGACIALFIALWEINRTNQITNEIDISPFAPMVLLSWITVFWYIYMYFSK